ncbi:MAG TPA: glycosyltransferase family 2 protein, partial [Phycisphaerae bacterium]|nr:glycosyltransferase family 2 protein [Phycisphaerae bacterium]
MWPTLSVIVPACDEADKIEPAARSLLALDYPGMEIIFVDDRSTDETGPIIDRLAADDTRVRAIHVTELPDGWLGKVHALDTGLRASSGELVLFTDADVHFRPGAMRRAVALVESRGLDFLAVLPRLWATSMLLDSLIAAFIRQYLLLMTRPWALSRAGSRSFIGVGAFNLLRRSALEGTPGLEWLRMEVGDDAALGQMMRQSGRRCGAAAAFEHVALHWHRTVGEACRGAEKGWSTVCRFSLARSIALAAGGLALEAAPVLALAPLAFPSV